MRQSTAPLGRWATAAIGLEVLLGVGAVGGGIALMAGPNGAILPLPVSALAGSPFTDYFVPGAILFTVLGLGPLAAAALAWRLHPLAPFLSFAVGGALLVWLPSRSPSWATATIRRCSLSISDSGSSSSWLALVGGARRASDSSGAPRRAVGTDAGRRAKWRPGRDH